MQARRITTSSPHLPSSPPSALLQEGEAYSPTEARGVPSPAQTLWTAPSPTQTLGHSSPELPPLPSLALGGLPRTPSTVARHQATDSTYYTASWGSPYQRPPPGFSLGSALRDPLALGSDDLEEDSSSLQFGLEHLLPSRLTEDGSPNQFSLDHLLPSRLPANQAQTPTKSTFTPKAIVPEATPRPIGFGFSDPPPEELLNGPTGNWVRQFLAGNWDNEKANWWSDESTDNESGVKKQVQEQQPSSEPQAKEKKGHKSRKENLTLKQQDFWAHFSRDQKESFGKMMSSKYADPSLIRKVSAPSQEPQLPSPVSAEKPLPPPPTEEITQTSPKVTSGPIPQSPMNEHATRLPSAPRPRKKVPWKGKSCWVFIPTDVARGTPGYPPKPLSSPEVLARMQHFEQAGYDTRGFGREEEDVTGSNGLAQNRAVFPDTADYVEDRNSGPFRVRIPNKTEWEAYVNYLTEQKLAALGVSIGGEEEETPMSRNPSSQYPGLPFSPPPPTSSGGSQRHGHHGSVISSAFPHGPSPGHASTRSIASPISPFGNPRGSMHMHRHSTFTSPSNFTPQQPTPPGIPGWSPQQYFGPQGARGGSPALQHSRPDLGDVVSPGSPYGFRQNQQYPFPQKEDLLVQMQQQQQQQLQSQLLHQQQQQLLSIRPSSTLAEVPEDEAEEDEVPKIKQDGQPGPHIAVPTPRGHRHNISENLEKEIQIQDAEYHLEQAIDKQLEEGGEFSTEPRFGERDPLKEHINLPNPHASGSSWEEARPVQQVLHQPQPHSRAHSLAKPQRPVSFNSQITDNQHGEMSDGAKTNISEITNPSLEDGCKRAGTNGSNQHSKTTSQASNAWKDSKPPFDQPGPVHNKHTSKSSISKLNVEAKEFKFSPAASFNPGNFQFSGFALSPVSSKPLSKEDPAAPRTNKPSLDGLGSGLNVTAPAFKPGGMNGSAFPTSNFDFLSKAPSFKPDAPAFKPSLVSPGFAPSPLIPVPSSVPSRIFGNINFNANDIIKPARRSKAVPIVRPDNTQQQAKGNEDKEDESGRITQADGREKRARHGRDDGNEVPQFALPSHPLSETTQFQAAKQDPQIEREPVAENKENLSPEAEQNQAKPKTPELSPTVALQREESSFGPVVRTPKTDEMSATMSDSNIISGDHDKRETESVTPTVEEEPKPFTKKHASKGSLSATAKPFEYRPQFGSGFDFGLHVTKPSVARSEDYDNIHTSPQRHVSRSPATTFRPSDDGSYQTAPEPRKHAPWPENESVDFDYAHPSFNEIDAVMKHLNEEGSDFGVEKDDTPWDQSSPRRSLHDFDHKDLQPSKNLRSDAPSPSPRRLYAPASGTLGASSASITHDPFSDERAGLAYESPVHRLNNADEIPVSDWDEGISSEGEDKIQTRSRFFDSHVNALIGRLLQDRLGPLEKSLQFIQDAVGQMTQRGGRSRRSMSNDRLDSDADDEDDEVGAEFHYRNRSPRKDRKLEKIRAIVMEALASHQPQNAASEPAPATALEPVQPHLDMSEFYQALGDVKASIARSASSSVQPEDFREMIEEALKRQSAEINQRRENQAADENEARIADLESMFREATLRVDAEVEARKAIESREASTQHLLKVTEEELTLLRESSQDDENKLRALNHECQDARIKIDAYHIAEEELRTKLFALAEENDDLKRTAVAYESSEEDLRKKLSAVTAENEALQFTLEEYRLSSNKWRDEIQQSNEENAGLKKAIESLKSQSEESTRIREAMRGKLEKLQQDMVIAMGQVAAERAQWQKSDEEHMKKYEVLSARIEAEGRTRERLERELERLEVQEREGMRLKVVLEQTQQANARLEESVNSLRLESSEYQKASEIQEREGMRLKVVLEQTQQANARLEESVSSLRLESSEYQKASEIQEREGMKLKVALEQTQQANSRLEESVNSLRLESSEHQKAAEKFERDFHEAREAGRVELQRTRTLMEADIDVANNQVNIVRANLESEIARLRAETDNVRMDADTAKARHELQLEEAADSKRQALDEAMALRNAALQEQQDAFERRIELLQQEHARALQISVEDRQRSEEHLKERLSLADATLEHLRDKVDLLEEKLSVAKSAAHAAVQAAQSAKAPVPATSHHSNHTGMPEKISPQALRESIAVLQEQLQERESRIEGLEEKLSKVDTEAPAKLKERDTEIGWLRELLGVRVDDITDLINALSQPTFDRDGVRDAAIRIRTNLQMEQHEKERLMTSGQAFPTLASLSNFASPKAVQLAAAFGNWRRGRDTATSSLSGASSSTSRTQTPSRVAPFRTAPAPSAQSFLSGLMTPPTSNLRRTPQAPSSIRPQNSRSNSSTSTFRDSEAGFPGLGKQTIAGAEQHAPSTPPLLGKASYDQDAEDGRYSENGFYDDEDSTVDGNPGEVRGFDGFGPGLLR